MRFLLVGGFGNDRDTSIVSDVGLLKDNLALAFPLPLPHVFLLYSVISQTRLRRREKRDEEVAD